MSQAEQARRFAAALLGGHGELLSGLQITLSTLPGPSTRWLPAQPDAVADAALAAAQNASVTGVYLGVGLTRGPVISHKRLVVADTAAIVSLWADIDVAGTAHGHGNRYPPDKQAALQVARSTGLEPTSTIDTGHGIQSHWRLRDPLIFGWDGEISDDGHPIIDESRVDDSRAKARELAWAWFTTIRIHAQRMGEWILDPVGDLARLVRIPGSTNKKVDGDFRRVQILDCDPSRAYDLDEITAALAPETLLKPYRSLAISGTDLEGVDLPALFAEAKRLRGAMPDALAAVSAAGWDDGFLADIWSGANHKRYEHDGNAVDMGLIRWCLRYLTPADAALAVMCRRVHAGDPEKLRKVDPASRTSYLATSIGKVAATLRGEAEEHAARLARSERALSAALASQQPAPDPAPVPVGTLTLDRDAPPPLDEPEPPDDEPEPTPPAPLPPLRAAPEPVNDPRQGYADAPREPRGGIDDPGWIQGPTDDEQRRIRELNAILGLPEGISVWAVGMRKMADKDEIRVWFHRDEGAIVHGGDWPVGSIRWTNWRSKREWATGNPKAAVPIQEFLLEDLHIVCTPASSWKAEGRLILYSLARTMTEGTPAAIAQLAIAAVLGRTPGTAVFARVQETGEPWVTEHEVWLRFDLIRDEVRRSGMGLGGIALVDVLAEMGCRVRSNGLAHTENGQRFWHPAQWVLLPPSLPGTDPEWWSGIRRRAQQNDDDVLSARRELRRVGGE